MNTALDLLLVECKTSPELYMLNSFGFKKASAILSTRVYFICLSDEKLVFVRMFAAALGCFK